MPESDRISIDNVDSQARRLLPETQKQAADLRFSNSLSYQQVAATADISLSNSKVIFHRVKAELINILLI